MSGLEEKNYLSLPSLISDHHLTFKVAIEEKERKKERPKPLSDFFHFSKRMSEKSRVDWPLRAREPFLKGRLSTFDLLVLTSSEAVFLAVCDPSMNEL